MSDTTVEHVSVIDPDGPYGCPAYDGPVEGSASRLLPGRGQHGKGHRPGRPDDHPDGKETFVFDDD